uniref:Uncharacterized protein n=1 Tax=uncultured bacterium contig00070 TaxID=1181551 RepID=A0A806K1S9_9BACT|nr:hypothetical protein [uncultured bacterium contig00070]
MKLSIAAGLVFSIFAVMENLAKVNEIADEVSVLNADDKIILFYKIKDMVGNAKPSSKEALKAKARSLQGLYSDSPIPNKKELAKVFYENAAD